MRIEMRTPDDFLIYCVHVKLPRDVNTAIGFGLSNFGFSFFFSFFFLMWKTLVLF